MTDALNRLFGTAPTEAPTETWVFVYRADPRIVLKATGTDLSNATSQLTNDYGSLPAGLERDAIMQRDWLIYNLRDDLADQCAADRDQD